MSVCSLTMLLSWNCFPHISHWYTFTFEYVAALVQQENCLAVGNVHMSLITRMLICLSGDNYHSYKKLREEIMTPTLPWQNSSHTNPSTWTSYWDNRIQQLKWTWAHGLVWNHRTTFFFRHWTSFSVWKLWPSQRHLSISFNPGCRLSNF